MVLKGLPERTEVTAMMDEGQVNDLIQRWRDTPEDELTPEDRQHFNHLGRACLTRGDTEHFLNFLQDDKNQRMVKSMGCVLLAPLVKEASKNRKSCDHVQAAIAHVTTTCRPDEVLQSLLHVMEDADPDAISQTLVVVVSHLQTGLLRLEEGRASSLGSALRVLHEQLARLPVPYSERWEEDDRFGLGRCCDAMSAFTETFVEEARNDDAGKRRQIKMELLNFCMRSLREPLLEASLTPGTRTSPMWRFASHIVATLAAIRESAAELLFFSTVKKDIRMDKTQLAESKGCLAYLVIVKLLDLERFPIVFSPEFVLQRNVEYVHQLLRSKKESHTLKGLALFETCLERVADNSLPATLLELKSFHDVKQSLLRVLVECPMQHLRESGLKVLQLLINKLDAEAKHKLFRSLLKTSRHSGMEGHIVNNIRNQVELSMKPGNATRWFLGPEFVSLLGLVLTLPQGAETDLLHNMDKDRALRTNADVWEAVRRMKDEYNGTLRVCIRMWRTYYAAQRDHLRDEHKLKARAARASNCSRASNNSRNSLTVKGDKVSKMPPEVQHQVLLSALVTLDLMESLIVRTEEIAEEKNADRLDTVDLCVKNHV
ncbi:glomulin, FKBP associated protein b isoform X2 [Syngnathoides biaculeatus]|uniref:glomulin, FKBP associated protein b isoform X2 n=1 Tax=Syngnathoides biaculeatus TaxID=300417 RepID=UPI002ADE73D1|nr:glomulin, FKBP associated protein b isoform X2 [Syngnathoides biaculeatus]